MRQPNQLLQIARGRDVDIEHRGHALRASPTQRRRCTGRPTRIGEHHVGTVQNPRVERVRPRDRVAAVVENLALAARVDDDGGHRGRGTGHALSPRASTPSARKRSRNICAPGSLPTRPIMRTAAPSRAAAIAALKAMPPVPGR